MPKMDGIAVIKEIKQFRIEEESRRVVEEHEPRARELKEQERRIDAKLKSALEENGVAVQIDREAMEAGGDELMVTLAEVQGLSLKDILDLILAEAWNAAGPPATTGAPGPLSR